MRKAFDLRPLEFTDVMGRGFSLYATAFFAFARWFLIAWTLPMIGLTCGLYFLLEPYAWQDYAIVNEPSVVEANSRATYYWLLKTAAVVLGLTVGAAGACYTAARLYVGGRPSLLDVSRAMKARAGHLAGASFFHLSVVLLILLLVYGFPAWLIMTGNEEGGWALAVLFSAGGVPLLGWYLGTCGLNVACVMLDESDSSESFGRSAFLTKGFRMRHFGIIVTAMLLVGAPGVPGLLTVPAWIGQDLLLENKLPLMGDLMRVVWDGALLPLFFIPPVVFYYDMRCRKEGYDLAVMARNFGIEEGEMMRFRMNPHLGYMPVGYKAPAGRRAQPRPQAAPPMPQHFRQPPPIPPARMPMRRPQ